MKTTELRKLILEEIRKVVKEASKVPNTYDFNNPGDEWKKILTKAIQRFNTSNDTKVNKNTIKLFTIIYMLGFKNIGEKVTTVYAKDLATDLVDSITPEDKSPDVITYIKNDIDPTAIPNWADDDAKEEFKAGNWVRVVPQTKLEVGNKLVRMNDMTFAEIVKIKDDKVFLQFDIDYADEKPTEKTREEIQDNYLYKSK